MDAIILAGGYGTRLRPLTYTRPKPLLNVAGRPMVEWVLDRLPPEVDHVIVAVNWLAPLLEAHFKDSSRTQRFTVVQEDEPLGTAGAVLNCADHLSSDRFFVLNADIVSDMDLGAMAKQHKQTKAVGTVAAKLVEPAQVVDFGVIDPDPATPADGGKPVKIKGFVEKPKDPKLAPSRLVNAGAYLLERSVVDLIPPGRLVSMEKEIFPQLIPQGFWAWPFTGSWIDVGDPSRLRAASKVLQPDYKLGPGSRMDPRARWTDSVGGIDCEVGANATVVRSVLGDKVTVRPGVLVEDCVVGDGETLTRNMRGETVWSKKVPTGYPKQQVGNAK